MSFLRCTIYFSLVFSFREVSSVCIRSWITKCDDIEDIVLNKEMTATSTELLIGSEMMRPSKTVLVIKFPFEYVQDLEVLHIFNYINNIPSDKGWMCTYAVHLRIWNFYGNLMRHLPPFFLPIMNITRLSLTNNRIETVDDRAFSMLSYAETIDLSDNYIEIIDKDTFKIPFLNEVNLKNNQIIYLTTSSVAPNLGIINLENNQLNRIEADFIQKIRPSALILRNNKLTYIPLHQNMSKLEILDLSNNLLTEIATNTFKSAKNLKILNLSNNKLRNVEFVNDLLLVNPAVELYLSFNYLTNKMKIENGTLSNQTLWIYGNPWDCEQWDEMYKTIYKHQNQCDQDLFITGKLPYCICLRGNNIIADSQKEEYIQSFRNVINLNRSLATCTSEPKETSNAFMECIEVYN